LIGQSVGVTVFTKLGHPVLLLDPSLSDLMTHIKRGTQIIYPKDAAYLVHRLSLGPGSRVIEAGTGSGGLTTALAWAVAPTGTVFTYETRPEIFNLARNNLERVGMLPHVQMHQKSIAHGFDQSGVDALFLDVRRPWEFLNHVRTALRPGGYFASLVPTTNQVSKLLAGLEEMGFSDIAVEELLLRAYKPVPDRLRPDDNMVGHTGFMIFARHIVDTGDPGRWLSKERKRYAARLKTAEKIQAEEEKRASERAAGGPKYPRMPLPG
jgi:tRNA (adenine57-N1/adenine58-N1)-methyltransferase